MQPNIILINCDDLGYGDLSCYGSKKNATPILDKMAEEGIRFTDFYAASPVCSPSRGSLMTGCYPLRIGFNDFDGQCVLFPGQPLGLNPNEKTIANLLKEVGYSTMLVGKWHCGDQKAFLPTEHGFDHYYGIPYSNDMGVQVGLEGRFPPLPLMADEEVVQEQPDQTSLTERYMEQSVRFMRQNKDKPFFLYLAHMYVHLPIYVPERFLDVSQNGRYGGGVAYVDYVTEVILDELDRLGIRENTLVIFTSDNGSRDDNGDSNAPLRGTKATTWEGGQRVPFIVNWKGTIEGGQVSDAILSNIDLYPTLAKLAGAKVPEDRIIDGLENADLILGKTDQSKRDTFLYFGRHSLEAIRVGDYKLHVRRKGEDVKELYNLGEDIGETHNIYDERPDLVANMMQKVEAARLDLGDEALGIQGQNVRPIGRIEKSDTLTHYNKAHPYMIMMYDLDEHG